MCYYVTLRSKVARYTPLRNANVHDCVISDNYAQLKRLDRLHVYDCFVDRGRWHGDVFIYCFNGSSELDMAKFLREVTRLSKIRHENICLFMGACLQPPKLAVITR